MELYQNDFFLIQEEMNSIFIQVYKKGFHINGFEEILRKYPRITITSFLSLRSALQEANGLITLIGEYKPPILLTIPNDKMSASIRINCNEEDLKDHYESYVTQILQILHEEGVKEGILVHVLSGDLSVQKDIIIAEGIKPIHGSNATIEYYPISERKPTIREDGKADYYDMNFVDEVKKGDCLGKKTPPTPGIPGKTITGNILLPKRGKDERFSFDKKTVGEFEEDGKVVLKALIDGVVTYTGGKISINDHLIIEGDVGVETGNIEFDGSITIKGIVQSGFSVTATRDIAILGELGISGVKEIRSQQGDIYIKGGIFGKGESIVTAGKNIFVKYANACFLQAKEDIHIGYYSIGSIMEARNVIANERKGKIIGGKVKAKGKVQAAIIGNRMGRNTIIEVEGFNRKTLQDEIEKTLLSYKKELLAYKTVSIQVETFENLPMNETQKFHYENLCRKEEEKLAEISKLDEKSKYMMTLLETKGEGEITITNVIYPETYFQIKNLQKRFAKSEKGVFYVQGRRLYNE